MVSVCCHMRFPAFLIHGSLIGRKKKTLEFKIIPLIIFCFAHLPLSCIMFTIHCSRTSHKNWEAQILIQYRVIIHLFHMKSRWSVDKTLCENYNELKHLMQLFINFIKMGSNFRFYLLRIVPLYRALNRLLGLVSNCWVLCLNFFLSFLQKLEKPVFLTLLHFKHKTNKQKASDN